MAKEITGYLGKLEGSNENEKAQVYKSLMSFLVSSDEQTRCNFQNFVSKILVCISKDLENSSHHATHIEALNLLMQIVENDSFIEGVDPSVLKVIVTSLIKILCSSSDRNICSRSLICLSRGKYSHNILKDEMKNILVALKRVNQTESFKSTVIDRETLILLNNVFICNPSNVRNVESFWFNLIHQMLFHEATKVREKAYQALKTVRALFVQTNSQDVLSKLYLECFQTNENNVLKWKEILHSTTDEREIDLVFSSWMLIISILGRELHNSLKIINQLMPVMEKGFERMTIKHKAFNSWRSLIENFALDQDGLCRKKKLKLLLTPLLTDIAKSEQVVEAKLKTWWFLICKIGCGIAESSEEVLIPFLSFCFGISSDPHAGSKDSSNRLHPSGFLMATECLSQIMPVSSSYVYSVSAPYSPVLNSPSVFNKYHRCLLDSVRICLQNELEKLNPKLNLLHNVWVGLLIQCKGVLEVEAHRKSAIGVIHDILLLLEHLVSLPLTIDESRGFVVEMVYHFYKVLPHKTLSSTAFGHGNIMNGTPASSLAVILVSKSCMDSSLLLEQKYLTLFQSLLSLAITTPGFALLFIQSIIEHLNKSCLESKNLNLDESRRNVFCNVSTQLWLKVADALLEQIKLSQEVNQGDSIEHDFTCCYNTLMFPIKNIINNPVVTQNAKKVAVKLWCDLYKSFFTCGTLVTTVENNAILEATCKKIFDIVNIMPDLSSMSLEYLSSLVKSLTITADLKLFDQPKRYSNSKKVESVNLGGNITSLVSLLKMMIPRLFSVSSNDSLPSVTSAVINILDVVKSIYSRVSEKQKIQFLTVELSQPLSLLYTTQNVLDFGPIYKEKLETVWNAIISALMNHYLHAPSGLLLDSIAPLLINCFSCPKPIVTKARVLWSTLFNDYVSDNTVPADLQMCLRALKPPLMSPLTTNKDENAQADESQPDSETLNGDTNTNPPLNAYGKFLLDMAESPNKEVKVKATPTKTKSKSLDLSELPAEEFVVINSSRKRCSLTDHQKEMREKKTDIPALYNDLSQDSSMITLDDNTQLSCDMFQTKDKVTELTSEFLGIDALPVRVSTIESKDLNDVKDTDQKKDLNDSVSSEPLVVEQAKTTAKKLSQSKKRKSEIDSLASDSLDALFGQTKKKKFVDVQGNFSRLVSLRCRRNLDSCVDRKKFIKRLNYESVKRLGRKSLRFRKLIPDDQIKKRSKNFKVITDAEKLVTKPGASMGDCNVVPTLDSSKEERSSDEINITEDCTPEGNGQLICDQGKSDQDVYKFIDEAEVGLSHLHDSIHDPPMTESFIQSKTLVKTPEASIICENIQEEHVVPEKPVEFPQLNHIPAGINSERSKNDENMEVEEPASTDTKTLEQSSDSVPTEQTANFDLSSLGLVRVSDILIKNSLINKSPRSPNLRSNSQRNARMLKLAQGEQKDLQPVSSPFSNSILKRKDEEESSAKKRQVHFADPPVSSQHEIPIKIHRVDKELHHASVFKGLTKGKSNPDDDYATQNINDVQAGNRAIFPSLVDCKDLVENIIPQLTSSTWTTGILQLLRSRNINTVGDLCKLSEVEVKRLLITQPNKVKQVLDRYFDKLGKKNKVDNNSNDVSEPCDTEMDGCPTERPIDKIIKSLSIHGDSSKLIILEQLRAAKKLKVTQSKDKVTQKQALSEEGSSQSRVNAVSFLKQLDSNARCGLFLESCDNVGDGLKTLLNVCKFEDLRQGLDDLTSKSWSEMSDWWDETLYNKAMQSLRGYVPGKPLSDSQFQILSGVIHSLPKSQFSDLMKLSSDGEAANSVGAESSVMLEKISTDSLLSYTCDRLKKDCDFDGISGLIKSVGLHHLLENVSPADIVSYVLTNKRLLGQILLQHANQMYN